MSTISIANLLPSNSGSYFPLGGGSDISIPPVTNRQSLDIGTHVNGGMGLSCGFNPAISISNSLSHIESGVQGIQQNVINSATGAVASMPMYLLEKSNKNLYNLLQNAMTGASDQFNLSTKSCTSAMHEINSGKSPYRDWFSVSDGQGWLEYQKRAQQGQAVDVNTAKDQIIKDPDQYGIPWFSEDTNQGGANQKPIHVFQDIIVAGYNVLIGSNILSDESAKAEQNTSLFRFFPTARDAKEWTRLVLGDITISDPSKSSQMNNTNGGIGLITLVESCPDNSKLTCAKTVGETLAGLVASDASPSANDLLNVGSDQLHITPELLDGIRNQDKQTQTLLISKFSQDIAIQNAVGKALILRRLLLAGRQTRQVQALKPALDGVNQALSDIDEDIKNLMFQMNINKQLMGQTSKDILQVERSNQSVARSQSGQDQSPLEQGGAIYKNGNSQKLK